MIVHASAGGPVHARIRAERAGDALLKGCSFSSLQTMVYTIHEIPIFIAMGVVGKGHPVKERFLSLNPLPRWRQATSSGVRVCGGVRAWQIPGLAQL